MRQRVDFSLAWKDEDYRASLSETERAALPECPVGSIEAIPGDRGQYGGVVLKIAGYQPVEFSWLSVLINCEAISEAMSSTSTCCCFAVPEDPRE